MRNTRKRPAIPPELFVLRDRFVMLAGTIESVIVETNTDPQKIDHVWIELRAGDHALLQITLNTRSWKSVMAGFDPRVRLGIVTSTRTELPLAGARVSEPLDYATIYTAQPVDFSPHERAALEKLLVKKAKEACFVQGWGEFYVRAHRGIHQVHSRHASFAHPVDHQGKDGAVAFYFAKDRRRELLLFKFAGQP
jgi:hypothetical protein